jgi:hypothetical protein
VFLPEAQGSKTSVACCSSAERRCGKSSGCMVVLVALRRKQTIAERPLGGNRGHAGNPPSYSGVPGELQPVATLPNGGAICAS